MDETTSAWAYGYRGFAVSGYKVFCLSLFEDLLQEILDTQAQSTEDLSCVAMK